MNQPDANDHISVAYATAEAFIKKNPSFAYLRDDLRSEAALAMVEACANWDPRRSSGALSTHLVKRCQYGMLNYLKRNELRFLKILKVEDVFDAIGSDEEVDSWEELVPGSVMDIVAVLDRLDSGVREDAEDIINYGHREAWRNHWHCGWPEAKMRRDAVLQAIENIGEILK